MKRVMCLICTLFISINMVLFAKTYNTCKIVISRNENNGYMNVIESHIVIEKKETIITQFVHIVLCQILRY